MQALKIGCPANLGQIISISTLTDPDLSPAGTHSNPLVRKQSDRTGLEDHILGHGDFLAEVVLRHVRVKGFLVEFISPCGHRSKQEYRKQENWKKLIHRMP